MGGPDGHLQLVRVVHSQGTMLLLAVKVAESFEINNGVIIYRLKQP